MKLTFSHGNHNAKLFKLEKVLQKKVISFSLPSGYSCPAAHDCLSRANKQTGQITDGKNTTFRCFHASMEMLYKPLRKKVWNNFETLRKLGNDYTAMAKLIQNNLPDFFNVCRIHVGGDFFSQTYFDAWLEVAKSNPSKRFYAYTKSLPFWIKRLNEIPENFVLTASRGGKYDSFIEKYHLKCAEVVFSEAEAKSKNLEIDHDDSHACIGKKSFALLLHGVQPANTPAAKALSAIRFSAKKVKV